MIVLFIYFVPTVIYITRYVVPFMHGIDYELFYALSYLVTHTISITFPAFFSLYWNSQNRRLLLKSDYRSFEQMTRNPYLWTMFKEHVAKDLAIENCLFIEQLKNFENDFELYAHPKTQPLANPILISKYLDIVRTFCEESSAEFKVHLSTRAKEPIRIAMIKRNYYRESLYPSI